MILLVGYFHGSITGSFIIKVAGLKPHTGIGAEGGQQGYPKQKKMSFSHNCNSYLLLIVYVVA